MRREIIESRVIYICDVCLHRRSHENQCRICKKQLCGDCIIYDKRDSSDYPPQYCQRCWDIGTPYRKLENEAEEAYDVAIEDIWNEWKKEGSR